MATLTRSNSRVNSPIYKDYVNFLASYKNGKKEDENAGNSVEVKNFPLSNSSNNTSSSSLSSDVPDFSKNSCTPFNTYLENSKSKKFSSVKPAFEEKDKSKEEAKPQEEKKEKMKSEIFIEIQPTKSVSEVSKMFENPQERKSPPRSNKINSKISLFEKQVSVEKPKLAAKPSFSKSPPPKIDIYKDAKVDTEKETMSPLKVDTPPPIAMSKSESEKNVPPPPPMPTAAPPKPVMNGSAPLMGQKSPSSPNSPPPPPPPPPVNLSQPPKLQATLTRGPQTKYTVTNPNGGVPVEIDRNNPLVKKLVYGTLRGLYGAYHDKANDMLATLPKNMVVRSNGVQDRIEQIA